MIPSGGLPVLLPQVVAQEPQVVGDRFYCPRLWQGVLQVVAQEPQVVACPGCGEEKKRNVALGCGEGREMSSPRLWRAPGCGVPQVMAKGKRILSPRLWHGGILAPGCGTFDNGAPGGGMVTYGPRFVAGFERYCWFLGGICFPGDV